MAQDSLDRTTGFRYSATGKTARHVTILDGRRILQQIDLQMSGGKEIRFGRKNAGTNPEIELDSPIVSRMHGRFVLEEGRWFIEDLNSTNGILCNGAYIKRRALAEGDIYRIGNKKQDRSAAILFLVSSDLPDTGWVRYPLAGGQFTIGRSPDNSLVLPFSNVSRKHAVLLRDSGGWSVRNLSSANGILVNDQFVQGQIRLYDQDVICVCSTRIIFTSEGLLVCSNNRGISVDARSIVVRRGRGRRSFITSDHVDLTIVPGELVAIIGGSGAGKSTIMNVLCGYLKPNEGTVYINGNDLYRNFDALRNCFGYVPQSDIVYNNLTLYDMLKYTAELRLPKDTSREERDRAIRHAISLVELEDKTKSLIRDLSGGQRKRASIAVELLSDPKLLFLDEPASGLDPGTERSLMQSLKRMTNAGKTIILVTHSTLQLGLCDKIVFMGKGGRLCYFGNEKDALAFFRTKDIVDVYAKITDQSAEWHERYVSTCVQPEEKKKPGKVSEAKEKRRFQQLSVLCRRYVKLTLNDRQRLMLLILQAPLLAALISLVADGGEFKQYEMTKSLLFALSCSGFWVGMLNAIQEICKERTVLKREYMTGLSLSAYLLSKIIVLGVLCLIQCAMLIAVFSFLVGAPDEGLMLPSIVEMFVTAWLTALSAAAMGLFVSSLFTNPDRAMTVAPLLLMPQMLFSGLLFELSGATEYISWFAICRWSMEGFGTTANLNDLPTLMQEQGLPVVHEAEDFFKYTTGHLWTAWLMMAGFTAVFLILARIALFRTRKAVS